MLETIAPDEFAVVRVPKGVAGEETPNPVDIKGVEQFRYLHE